MFDKTESGVEQKSKINVDRLRERIDGFGNSLHNWWENLDDVRKKVNGLYKLDRHNTERPKVDILSDSFADQETNLWDAVIKLQERIEKLEEKKK